MIAGLGLLTTVGPHTSFFPTIFLAYFAIGLGIGSAFMPLLTIAMADVPAADAGLGSGIVNVSQQVSGALGLAVLGTLATNHTHALEAAHHVARRVADRRLSPRVRDRRGERCRRDPRRAHPAARASLARAGARRSSRRPRAYREFVPDLERQAA